MRHRWDNKLSREIQTVKCIKCGLYKETHYPMCYMYYYDPKEPNSHYPRVAPECRGYMIELNKSKLCGQTNQKDIKHP